MASLPACSALLFAFALATAAAQELPKHSGPAEIDPEPKLILTDVPDVPLASAPADIEPQSPVDVVKLEAAVESAKKNAALRDRLFKAGVISKLEAEQAQMKIVRLTRDLENARLAAAEREVAAKRQQPPTDDTAKAALAEAESRLAAATAAAQDAAAKWDQAQRAAAELRVQRERKLVALGADPKLALKQAEAALQKLTSKGSP